jgi:hypothetical protein
MPVGVRLTDLTIFRRSDLSQKSSGRYLPSTMVDRRLDGRDQYNSDQNASATFQFPTSPSGSRATVRRFWIVFLDQVRQTRSF